MGRHSCHIPDGHKALIQPNLLRQAPQNLAQIPDLPLHLNAAPAAASV